MDTLRTFSADTETELWQQVIADMALQKELVEYSAQLNLNGQTVYFDVDIDLGGGFESGYSSTHFLAPVPVSTALRFHLHKQDWLNEIAKVFGIEDVRLGYADLDEAFIVKTNQPEKLSALLSDDALRVFLLKHKDCEFELKQEEEGGEVLLTFSKDEAILDVVELQEVYHWIREVLQRIG